MKKYFFRLFALSLIFLCFLPMQLYAADSKPIFSQAELDQMVAPVALYPDSLLSQIFMASTYPSDVAEAVIWSKNNSDQEGDKAVKAVQNKSWDPSVMSLVAFPQVLEMMGKEPDWVQNLGDAFLAEPDKVMDTVQSLRKKAKDEGNLKTTEQQTIIVVQESPEIIVIQPVDPTVVYVPVYNPTVVYGTWWWPSYRPYYYYPPRYGFGSAVVAGIGFGVGVAITNSLWGRPNWRRGDIDINVNRYNNVNVNKNRINASNKTTNWNHNSSNRRGVPYRDKTSQQKFNNNQSGLNNRQDFRGRDTSGLSRDADRQRAQETLKKRGDDPAAARRELSGSGGDKVRSQVNNIDRSRNNNFDSGQIKNTASQRKNTSLKNSSLQNKSTRDKSRTSKYSSNRSGNNSFSGIHNQSNSSRNFNRGSHSRSSSGVGRGRR